MAYYCQVDQAQLFPSLIFQIEINKSNQFTLYNLQFCRNISTEISVLGGLKKQMVYASSWSVVGFKHCSVIPRPQETDYETIMKIHRPDIRPTHEYL